MAIIAPLEVFASPEISAKPSDSGEKAEGTQEFLMVLKTTASDRKALPDVTLPTMQPSAPQATSNAEEKAEVGDLPQPQEPTPLDSTTAPLLLLGMLMPSQLGIGLTAPTNTLDQAGSRLGQVLEGASSISPQASPTLSSSTNPSGAGQGIPSMGGPESHETAASFPMLTLGGMDSAIASVTDSAPVENLDATFTDRSGLQAETTPIVTQSIDRAPQASAVDYTLIEAAHSFPDPASVSMENAHAMVSSPSIPAAADTPLESHAGPSQENSDASAPQPSVGGQQSTPPIGMGGDMEVTADPGLLNGDHRDASTSGDLEVHSTPGARNLESSEAPVSYAEATQRASVMPDASMTPVRTGPADQRGIHAEPQSMITQLSEHLHVAVKGGQQELSVQLTPENLGTVHVNILTEQLEVHARLLVDNPAVKEALEANLHKLRDALQAQGLHVQDISVSVGQHAPQQESLAGHLSSEERRWKTARGFTASRAAGEIPPVSGRMTLATDPRQVDLFA